jgi:predicted secreted protein
MANELLSKTVSITYDSVDIVNITGFSLEVNKETVDITSFSSGAFKDFLVDLKDWSISYDAVTARTGTGTYETMMVDMLADTTHKVVTFADSDASTTFTGNGHITSLSDSGSVGDKQAYSCTIQGTGTLTLA